LKRKLIDFAKKSAIFLITRRVLAFFRANPTKSFNQPDFFIRSAGFYQSSGQPRVNPGKQEGGRSKKKSKNRRVLFLRYLAANDVALREMYSSLNHATFERCSMFVGGVRLGVRGVVRVVCMCVCVSVSGVLFSVGVCVCV